MEEVASAGRIIARAVNIRVRSLKSPSDYGPLTAKCTDDIRPAIREPMLGGTEAREARARLL